MLKEKGWKIVVVVFLTGCCKTVPLDFARGEELSLFFMVSEVEPSSLQRKNEFFSILLILPDSGLVGLSSLAIPRGTRSIGVLN